MKIDMDEDCDARDKDGNDDFEPSDKDELLSPR
jgi:hypothetical protein